jgi:hypothetical protein
MLKGRAGSTSRRSNRRRDCVGTRLIMTSHPATLLGNDLSAKVSQPFHTDNYYFQLQLLSYHVSQNVAAEGLSFCIIFGRSRVQILVRISLSSPMVSMISQSPTGNSGKRPQNKPWSISFEFVIHKSFEIQTPTLPSVILMPPPIFPNLLASFLLIFPQVRYDSCKKRYFGQLTVANLT